MISDYLHTKLMADNGATFVINTLEGAGFEAWVVGGFVRDCVIAHTFEVDLENAGAEGGEAEISASYKDIDIATSATWEEVCAIFRAKGCSVIETGTRFGSVSVRFAGQNYEVTTFRCDGKSLDSRHPDTIEFADCIEEDLARRDFCMNAIAYSPTRGLRDPFDGIRDILACEIRCVGTPGERFDEDALRILRAIRFNSQLGFNITPDTKHAIFSNAAKLEGLSKERVGHEFKRFCCGRNIRASLLEYSTIFSKYIPELSDMQGFDQKTPYHCMDLLEHTASVMENVENSELLRLAALFHDMGKVHTMTIDEEGVGHFYGHPEISQKLAITYMRDLRMPTRLAADVAVLVKYHDWDIFETKISVKEILRLLDGRMDLFENLCKLRRADQLGKSKHIRNLEDRLPVILGLAHEILDSGEAFLLSHLKINGKDLVFAGIAEGTAVGLALNACLDAVVHNEVANTHDELLSYALDLPDFCK